MIRGVISDMDGVLLNSLRAWNDSVERIIGEYGYSPDERMWQELFPTSLEQGCAYLQQRFSLPLTAEQVQLRFEELLRKYYASEVQPMPGAPEAVAFFRQNGIPMVLATSSPREHAVSALERLGLLSGLRAVLTTSDVGESKHSPAIYLQAARLLGLPPEDILVMEDSLYALRTAKAAGFLTLGLYSPDGEADQQGLKAEGTYYLHSLAELPALHILG